MMLIGTAQNARPGNMIDKNFHDSGLDAFWNVA
jgi:hypothetical protein